MEDVKIPRFVTITQAAKMGVMSVYSLRLMLKQGQLPGYYAGTRFYINLDRLLEQLENGNSAAGQEPNRRKTAKGRPHNHSAVSLNI